ncbi:MAG: hypothetical protein KG075_15750 [Alphaproteobacteria bacterium]|nr:hypothetical protein [Alphaproteobacteria bacterium]
MPEGGKYSIKTRYVWLTLADWRTFSDALAETYPQARYDIRPAHDTGPDYPDTIWYKRLMDVPLNVEGMGAFSDKVIMTFDADWTPEYKTFRLPEDSPDTVRWMEKPDGPTLPFVQFRRHTAPTPSQLAIMTRFDHSDIHYFCPDDSEHATAEARRFFRLLGKFCTNRDQTLYRLPGFDRPGYEFAQTEPKGSWFWLGHDAIRWASENPDRMMRYLSTTGIRPCTEEEMAALAAQQPPAQES